ncbi:hypothetical protein, partial [Methylorubrum aminovorans]|uniref:hypothetical protein n=1 Tax=Methylorubrum aminovorans TaxID=269069 RepID=UPI001EE10565
VEPDSISCDSASCMLHEPQSARLDRTPSLQHRKCGRTKVARRNTFGFINMLMDISRKNQPNRESSIGRVPDRPLAHPSRWSNSMRAGDVRARFARRSGGDGGLFATSPEPRAGGT